MYVNTKLGVHVTPVGAVLWEHRAGVKSNTRGVNFNTTVFAVCQSRQAEEFDNNGIYREKINALTHNIGQY